MSANTQVSTISSLEKIDWSKELWFGLMFICIGWTVWPLMVYFLGRAIGLEYFLDLSLRVWAEDKVYGPISQFGWRSLSRILFLFFPWIAFFLLRFVLSKTRNNK